MSLRRSLWCIGLCVLALWAAGCPSAGTGDNQNSNDNGNDNGNAGTDVQAGVEIELPNEGNNHVPVGEQVTYEANPPASGPH